MQGSASGNDVQGALGPVGAMWEGMALSPMGLRNNLPLQAASLCFCHPHILHAPVGMAAGQEKELRDLVRVGCLDGVTATRQGEKDTVGLEREMGQF